jgi:hypothetical protein
MVLVAPLFPCSFLGIIAIHHVANHTSKDRKNKEKGQKLLHRLSFCGSISGAHLAQGRVAMARGIGATSSSACEEHGLRGRTQERISEPLLIIHYFRGKYNIYQK